MLDDLTALAKKQLKQLSDVRNIMLYLFVLIVLSIAWSSVRTIQSNYELQKQISSLKQQNEVIALSNQNIELQNKYYQTNAYLDLAARQTLGLSLPGEKVKLIPKNVAMQYVNPALAVGAGASQGLSMNPHPKYIQNLEDWRDFLLGRKLVTD